VIGLHIGSRVFTGANDSYDHSFLRYRTERGLDARSRLLRHKLPTPVGGYLVIGAESPAFQPRDLPARYLKRTVPLGRLFVDGAEYNPEGDRYRRRIQAR